MVELATMGVVIMPPVLTAYHGRNPSVEAMEDHLVGKVMAEFGMEFSKFRRWKG